MQAAEQKLYDELQNIFDSMDQKSQWFDVKLEMDKVEKNNKYPLYFITKWNHHREFDPQLIFDNHELFENLCSWFYDTGNYNKCAQIFYVVYYAAYKILPDISTWFITDENESELKAKHEKIYYILRNYETVARTYDHKNIDITKDINITKDIKDIKDTRLKSTIYMRFKGSKL